MKRRVAERLLVAGVGLIGGSLALALRERGLVGEVVGLGRSVANLRVAARRGIVDRFERDPVRAARDVDLVVVAVPVASIAPVIANLVTTLPPEAVITDVGSVKGPVVRAAGRVLGRTAGRFCGSHPIAGTEYSGAAAAFASLLDGQRCLLTPVRGTAPGTRRRVRALWEGVGMRVDEVTSAAHDRIFALVSHLPHVVAFSLANAIADAGGGSEALAYAAGGFRDTTRIAASAPATWRDILLANRDEVLRALDLFENALERLRGAIEAGIGPDVASELERGRALRAALAPTSTPRGAARARQRRRRRTR